MLFSEFPLGTNRTSEKLRMALGLTLNDGNDLSLVFLGDSRHALGEMDEAAANMPPVTKHLQMITRMKGKLFVEKGWQKTPAQGLAPAEIGRRELAEMMDDSDVLMH